MWKAKSMRSSTTTRATAECGNAGYLDEIELYRLERRFEFRSKFLAKKRRSAAVERMFSRRWAICISIRTRRKKLQALVDLFRDAKDGSKQTRECLHWLRSNWIGSIGKCRNRSRPIVSCSKRNWPRPSNSTRPTRRRPIACGRPSSNCTATKLGRSGWSIRRAAALEGSVPPESRRLIRRPSIASPSRRIPYLS